MKETAGNRTTITTLEGVNSYSYDSDNWLTAVSYPDSRMQQFTYGAVGNRTVLADSGTSVSPVAYSYDAANRLLSAVVTTSTNRYTYDGAGRLTNQTVNLQPRSYTYSFRSQTTTLTDTNASTFIYAFDGDGKRVVEGMQRYVYDGPNVVLELSNTVLQAAYVIDLEIDQPIERIQIITGVQDGRHVYHTDALGSVVAMTDSLGLMADSYTYEAFGKIRSESGTGLLLRNRYTYSAREALGDSIGLYYYRGLVMDPTIARYTSVILPRSCIVMTAYAYQQGQKDSNLVYGEQIKCGYSDNDPYRGLTTRGLEECCNDNKGHWQTPTTHFYGGNHKTCFDACIKEHEAKADAICYFCPSHTCELIIYLGMIDYCNLSCDTPHCYKLNSEAP